MILDSLIVSMAHRFSLPFIVQTNKKNRYTQIFSTENHSYMLFNMIFSLVLMGLAFCMWQNKLYVMFSEKPSVTP